MGIYFNNSDFDLNDDYSKIVLYHFLNFVYYPYQIFNEIPILNRSAFTQPIDTFFYKGSLNGQNITSSDFEWIFNPYYGNCYKLNTNGKLKAVLQNDNLLQLRFYVKHPYNITDYYRDSLYLIITPPGFSSFNKYVDVYFGQGGFLTKLIVKKSVFNKYPKPYSDCDLVKNDNGNYGYPKHLDRKYFDQIISAGYEYSQSLCISFCQIDQMGDNCTLRASSIKAPNNFDKFCPNQFEPNRNFSFYYPQYLGSLYSNTHQMYIKFFENKEINNKCEKMCPLECSRDSYEINKSLKIVDNDIADSNLDVDIIFYVGFSIKFQSLTFFNHDETPTVSIYNFVSNIGGVIGLLLGKFISII